MNKKVAAKNVIASLIYEIIAILYGFLIPRIILKTFGSEVNGLVSSLGQFLNYITLLEGGLTGVIMAALYKIFRFYARSGAGLQPCRRQCEAPSEKRSGGKPVKRLDYRLIF